MKEFVDNTKKIDQKMSKIPVEDPSPIASEKRLRKKSTERKKKV